VTDVEPGILNQVERFPDACWECGTKLRVARHRKRSQKKARSLMGLAIVVTVVWGAAVFAGGFLLVAVSPVRPRGWLTIAYLFVLGVIALAPGAAMARRARGLPAIVTIRCPKCSATGEFVKTL